MDELDSIGIDVMKIMLGDGKKFKSILDTYGDAPITVLVGYDICKGPSYNQGSRFFSCGS
ncbi:MAG: hypothetical protein AABX51_01720 [Nanoarchaeota archaeon]